ncbi:Hypothetical predicted protein, partial [Pelobates cultripes]
MLKTTGKGLTEVLLDHLQKHSLSLSDCRGQSYDNGSNMMGHKQGVQMFAIEKGDSETMSTAKSLHGEMKTWSFLLCTMTWYNVLYQINHVTKLLQSPNISMETLRSAIEGVKDYLEDFRENGIASCQTDHVKHVKKKRQSLYEGTDETFRRDFFLPMVDTALRSLSD